MTKKKKKYYNKVDVKRVFIVALFSLLMLLWLLKGPIKTLFKTKKKKGTAELYIPSLYRSVDISVVKS